MNRKNRRRLEKFSRGRTGKNTPTLQVVPQGNGNSFFASKIKAILERYNEEEANDKT